MVSNLSGSIVDASCAGWSQRRRVPYRAIPGSRLWAFTENCIAARFEYEWQDAVGQWWSSHGNENWKFDEHGCMAKRFASNNDQGFLMKPI